MGSFVSKEQETQSSSGNPTAMTNEIPINIPSIKVTTQMEYIISYWYRNSNIERNHSTTLISDIVSLIISCFGHQSRLHAQAGADCKSYISDVDIEYDDDLRPLYKCDLYRAGWTYLNPSHLQHQSRPRDHDFLFKICFIGDSGVGKTSFFEWFCEGRTPTVWRTTISIDFKINVLVINGQVIKLQLWDTCGQERFRTIHKAYFRACHGIFMMYDITDQNSLHNLKNWNEEIIKHAPENVKRIVVANKCDLKGTAQENVSCEMARDFCNELGISECIETSAMAGENVDKAVVTLVMNIMNIGAMNHRYPFNETAPPVIKAQDNSIN